MNINGNSQTPRHTYVPNMTYRVTRYVVNDFKWQIIYVRAIKYLLSCYQHLGKFNAIMCAKYHNRPLLHRKHDRSP